MIYSHSIQHNSGLPLTGKQRTACYILPANFLINIMRCENVFGIKAMRVFSAPLKNLHHRIGRDLLTVANDDRAECNYAIESAAFSRRALNDRA
jgi:hypothetical protein